MSAFIVDDAHINALVSYAVLNRLSYWNPQAGRRIDIINENAEEIGRILLDENVTSVSYRYGDRLDKAEKGAAAAYRFRLILTPPAPVGILKACNCLEYQSCEHPEWETSLAKRIVEDIKRGAISRLPDYDAADWEIVS